MKSTRLLLTYSLNQGCPKQIIATAGRFIELTVYRNSQEEDAESLNETRAGRYKDKSIKAACLIKAETLPPTQNASNLTGYARPPCSGVLGGQTFTLLGRI